jgi:hypothetical protein
LASHEICSPQPACSTAPAVERIASEALRSIHAISFVSESSGRVKITKWIAALCAQQSACQGKLRNL